MAEAKFYKKDGFQMSSEKIAIAFGLLVLRLAVKPLKA